MTSFDGLTHWISAISEAVLAVGVLFAWRQLKLNERSLEEDRVRRRAEDEARDRALSEERDRQRLEAEASEKALQQERDRRRRETAISLISHWSRELLQRSSSARKLAEKLLEEPLKNIYDQREFDLAVDDDLYGLIDSVLEGKLQRPTGGKLNLTVEQSSEIRWQMISYLNNLETVLSAWRHDVADTNILTEEFQFLIVFETRERIMERFRDIAGGAKSFPAIYQFVAFAGTTEQTEATLTTGRKVTRQARAL